MLAYILAIVVAIGSFSFYMAAFFVPEMHRRQDFLWSGLGLFYAVVLWFCAGRITGAVLLGQIVSVALLGGLGWHTFALRRDLTPETVRTPISWKDIEQWWQTLQRYLSKHLKLGSAAATLRTLWATVAHQIADLRTKTAGPRGMDSEVPPLQRSPAYEFETEAGTGDAVPSEFATVSTQERQAAAARDRADTATPATAEAAQPSESPEAKPLPTVEAERIKAPTEEETTPTALSTETASPNAATPPKTSPKPTETATAKATAAPNAQSAAQRTNPVVGLASWLGDVVKSARKPKPSRSVVEIPPRPPSIPRSDQTDTDQTTTSSPRKTAQSKPQRGVIDIPPRPPSIPRSPAAETDQPPKSAPSQRGRKSKPQRGVIDIPPRPPSIPRSPKPDTAPTAATSDSPATSADEANWVDIDDIPANAPPKPDANWADTSSAPTSTTDTSPMSSEAPKPLAETNWPDDEPETNWPDDDDTNWPD